MAFGDRVPAKDFNLNSAPRALWSDGTTMWVVTPRGMTPTDNVYLIQAYTLATGARDANKDIDSSGTNVEIEGIWSNGTKIWHTYVDLSDTATFVVTRLLATGAFVSGETFLLPGSPNRYLWSDGTILWVTRAGFAQPFSFAGVVDNTGNIDMRGSGYNTGDIWSDNTTLWGVVSGSHVSAYTLATGARDTAKEFNYHSDNANPSGMWSDGTTMWIGDTTDLKLYAYDVANPPAVSADASLSALAVNGHSIVPDFDAGTFQYGLTVPFTADTLTITATANNAGATVALPGADGVVTPAAGASTIYRVTVTAQDGTTTQHYNITVTRGSTNWVEQFRISTTGITENWVEQFRISTTDISDMWVEQFRVFTNNFTENWVKQFRVKTTAVTENWAQQFRVSTTDFADPWVEQFRVKTTEFVPALGSFLLMQRLQGAWDYSWRELALDDFPWVGFEGGSALRFAEELVLDSDYHPSDLEGNDFIRPPVYDEEDTTGSGGMETPPRPPRPGYQFLPTAASPHVTYSYVRTRSQSGFPARNVWHGWFTVTDVTITARRAHETFTWTCECYLLSFRYVDRIDNLFRTRIDRHDLYDWYFSRPPGGLAGRLDNWIAQGTDVELIVNFPEGVFDADTTNHPDIGENAPRFTIEINGVLTDVSEHALAASGRVGRSKAAHLERCLPMDLLITFDNESGIFDPRAILPDVRANWHWDYGGTSYQLLSGYVSSVRPQVDHELDLKTTIVHVQGALAVLAHQDHELSLFETQAIRTGDMIDNALSQAGWPVDQRELDRGQVLIHPAHYTSLLAGRRLQLAAPVIRGAEEAEVGLISEKRGDKVVFHDRFHRELDKRDSLFVFGTTEDSLQVEKNVIPEDTWDNIYTVVAVGAERAIAQSEGVVYIFRKETIDDNPLVINSDDIVVFTCDLVKQPQNRKNQFVSTVISWATPNTGDYEFRRDDTNTIIQPDADLRISFIRTSRTSTTVSIVNNKPYNVTLNKLELRGRGLALYGDLTIPELPDEQALAIGYRRRVLRLPVTFIGDGLNENGNAIKEGNAYGKMLLTRYARPQLSGRLPINPLTNDTHIAAMETLQLGDPVLVQEAVGLPGGGYWVEGLDFNWAADDNQLYMGVHVSGRGRRIFTRDVDIDVTATGNWVDVAPSVGLSANRRYVVAVKTSFPDGTDPDESSDVAVYRVRLTHNGVPVTETEWVEQDVAVGDPLFLGHLVEGPGDVTIQTRHAATGNIATAVQFCVVRIDS